MNEKEQGLINKIKKLERMKSDRSTLETHMQECYDYIVPRKNDVIATRTAGDKRGSELFDTTAVSSNMFLAAALHGMLTNPATRFFELVMSDPTLNSDEDVREWLQKVGDIMFTSLANTNFQTEIHEIYIDLGAIGTACLYMGEHEERDIHFNARAMKEVYIDENNLGLIDTVFRDFKWSARQIVQEFGIEKMPEAVVKRYEAGNDDPFDIAHAVEPWSNKEKSPQGFTYSSCYFLKDNKDKAYLNESGYREMPYAVPRWTKTSGEKYGRGPGMEMLSDIKMVNEMQRTTLEGAQLAVRPPLAVDDDGVIGRVRLTPGGLTVTRRGNGDSPIRPLIPDSRVDFGFQAVDAIRQQIRSGFYVNRLQLNDGPQMTATEVQQRTEEMMRFMGPVLGRQEFELLSVVIERQFGIQNRKGRFPAPPEKIKGKPFQVRYSSPIARAQRMNDAQNITRWITTVSPFINADPKVMDTVNCDEVTRYVGSEVFGVPQRLFRSARETQQLRAGRAAAQQKMSEQADEKHAAEVAGQTLPGAAQVMTAEAQSKK